jgi:hypothetical protein
MVQFKWYDQISRNEDFNEERTNYELLKYFR